VADQFQVKARAAFGTNSVASEAAAAKATGKRIAKGIKSAERYTPPQVLVMLCQSNHWSTY
jgi:hypothetical protein